MTQVNSRGELLIYLQFVYYLRQLLPSLACNNRVRFCGDIDDETSDSTEIEDELNIASTTCVNIMKNFDSRLKHVLDSIGPKTMYFVSAFEWKRKHANCRSCGYARFRTNDPNCLF